MSATIDNLHEKAGQAVEAGEAKFREAAKLTTQGAAQLIAAITIGSGEQTLAEEFDPGKSEYQSSCAPCHGKDGKGNGPVSAELKNGPRFRCRE